MLEIVEQSKPGEIQFAMGATQSTMSGANPAAHQSIEKLPHDPALGVLKAKFPSVASFDYSGTKVSEDDYKENLKRSGRDV